MTSRPASIVGRKTPAQCDPSPARGFLVEQVERSTYSLAPLNRDIVTAAGCAFTAHFNGPHVTLSFNPGPEWTPNDDAYARSRTFFYNPAPMSGRVLDDVKIGERRSGSRARCE